MSTPTRARRARMVLLAAATALVLAPTPGLVQAAGPGCATPGSDGTATITGVVNTYYPGTATAAVGATTITLGTATGSITPIAIGDLVLVIQMQDASIDSTNTGAYGDGVAGDPATGSTSLNGAGLYEYAVARSAVPLAGGSLTVGSGLINTYTQAGPTATQGQRDFQVIRVPQYVAATLGAALTAGPFNGSTGGVLVVDVDGALNLNGNTASVSQEGFRAGLGRQLAGGAGGTGTDYVNLSARAFHGQKGEGIAGTPQYLYDSRTGTTVNNGVDGYPNGSTARGAPGTAGGGGTDPHPTGNDENTGGGGGANGGAGGMGGNSWKSNLPMGGFGGTAFAATAARVTAGAGGGAGSRNDSGGITNASSGGNGGGIVMIRAGSIAGAGSITANGGQGIAPDNDGGGGGGAGGTVVVVTQTGGLGGLTVSALGGAGTNAWAADAGGPVDYHGPGGGGGGGIVLTSSVAGAINVAGGTNGTTTTDRNAYGATPGGIGSQAAITAGQIPGPGSGAACTSDLTLSKTHSDPLVRGGTGVYTLTANNVGGTATSGTTTVTDPLPAGLTPTAASGAGWTCSIAAQTVTCTSTAVIASNASFPAISITVAVAQSAPASLTNTATVSGGGEVNTANDSASDPTTTVASADVAVTKIASSGTVTVGSNVDFTVTAKNNGPSDATGVQVTDNLPVGLALVSASTATGTYTGGLWAIGSLPSGTTVTLTLTARVLTTGSLTNTARKTAENEPDPNTANDTASVTITGQASDLTLAKSHVGSFVRGSSGSYSLVASNSGSAATAGLVTVTDTLPAGLTPTTATGTGWTCGIAGQTVTCTRSDALAAGSSYPAITVGVTVAQGATSPVTNTASVAGGGELNTANDSASDPTTITSSADVAVTKVASSGAVAVGSTVRFTITATNNGPSDATGVQVTDALPGQLTLVSASTLTGTYLGSVWDIGSLSSGTTVTLSLTATVNATGSITNTATKTAETERDPNAANDSASVTITGQAPDLTIALSHVDPFVRGTVNGFSVVASNVGTTASSGLVTVTDTVPAGLTPTLASGTGWTCGIASQVVTCTRSDALAAGAAYPAISVTVSVLQTAPNSVTNNATVGGGSEINTANDSATDRITMASSADVGLTKTASSGTATVGSTVQFTITATNAGPSDASGVVVSDPLPGGLTFVSASATAGTYVSGTGLWTIGSLPNGTSQTLTITATVTTTGAHVNTATKTQTEPDPNGTNDSASASVNGLAPDLTISLSHVDPFVRGTNGSYSVVTSNVGTASTSGLVVVTDTVPAGLTPTAASGTGWACSIAGQVVTCTRSDSLVAGGTYPAIGLTVAVLQSAPSTVTDSVTVAGGSEINTANDSATDPTNIASLADVGLNKTASSGTATVGTTVQFTITATNAGPSDASGVVVTDLLPGGLSFVSASASTGSYVSGTGLWTIGPLPSGVSQTLTITATVTTTGAHVNTATKTQNESDPNPRNDSSSASVVGLPPPDVTIALSHVDPFVRGTTNSLSVVASNVGTGSTTGLVTVSDTVPAGLTPTAASGTGWTCGIAGQVVTCTRSDVLAPGAAYPAISVTVNVLQSAPNSVTNNATVAGGGELNTANDSATDPITITSSADVGVVKTASSTTPTVGSTVQFTITATNAGPSAATGVVVSDPLPGGMSFVLASATAGTYNNGTGLWTIGTIPTGTSDVLTITATVTATGSQVNTATKTVENEPDPNPANDSSSVSVNGLAPDLTISLSHVDPFTRGTSGSYTIVASNVGTASTSGLVVVTDTVPAGLTPTAAAGAGWTCNIAGQVVTCSRSDALAVAATYPPIGLTVSVLQTAGSTITNSVTIAGGGEINTANDTASDPATIASLADVAVLKTAGSGSVTVGSNVTYTITAHNAGPSNATGVQVTDLLPSGLTLVTATPSAGTYTAGSGLWNIGPIPTGSSVTLVVTATVTATGTITNTATKSAEIQSDPNTSNNTASAAISGLPTPIVPGPPPSGMAMVGNHQGPVWPSLLLAGALFAVLLLLMAVRRRSLHIFLAAVGLAAGTIMTLSAPAQPVTAIRAATLHAGPAIASDIQVFGKTISIQKPVVESLPTLHPATGSITPTRIRIPALNLDTTVESVGINRQGAMDVPSNIWDAAWLQTGARPGATGQAVIDGHLDSVSGNAVFINLRSLAPGDKIYVSDAAGNELTFRVTATQVAPLNGFPSLRVFGPSKGRFLNLITCAGLYDTAHRTYDHRLIVFTTLLS